MSLVQTLSQLDQNKVKQGFWYSFTDVAQDAGFSVSWTSHQWIHACFLWFFKTMARDRMSHYRTASCDDGFRRDRGIIAETLYWLSAKVDHDIKLLESTLIEDECFAHSVVVLMIDKKRKKIEIFIVNEAMQTLTDELLKSWSRQLIFFRLLFLTENALSSTSIGKATFLFIQSSILTTASSF
jgi:hypothetical protein